MKSDIKRFQAIVLLAIFIMNCAAAPKVKQIQTASSTVQIMVDPTNISHAANPLVLGNNIQWVDRADGILNPDGSFNQDLINKLQFIKISILRFPGGTLSDAYHWKDAVGPVGQRKKIYHPEKKSSDDPFFGTDEYINLIKTLHAEPVITVNTFSGTPDEAVEWMQYFNSRGVHVTYWEIGNEPYLEPPDKSPVNPNYPEIFARKFVDFATHMKAADPSIQVGLPLRSNLLGRYPGGAYQDWNKRVLPIAGQYADFGTLHDTYFPGIFKNEEFRDPDSFMTLFAAPEEVEKDIRAVKQDLANMVTNKRIPLAITEHNNFFATPNVGASKNVASLAGGIYTAILLSRFYKDPSIVMANFWSLTGNWLFGALNQQGKPRPQFYALKLFTDFVGRNIIVSGVQNSPVFSSPAAGYMPAEKNVQTIEALASSTGKTVFIIVINKSLNQNVPVSIMLNNFTPRPEAPQTVVMSGPTVKSDNEQKDTVGIMPIQLRSSKDLSYLVIPRHSIVALRVEGA